MESQSNFNNRDKTVRPLIARRFYYFMAELQGWMPNKPDAFVFTHEAAVTCNLELVRTYRLLNPANV